MLRHFEDFRIGDVYELGKRSVSMQEIVQFARSYDPQPRHLPGADGALDEIIASGWHVAGIFMRLYVDAVARSSAIEVSPGIDELRWLRPVRAGDLLTGRMIVIGASASISRPDCGILHQRGELVDKTGVLVMGFTFYSLMRKRL